MGVTPNYVPRNYKTVTVSLVVRDVEGLFENAIRAGAEVVFPIKEQFYGDRAGRIKDPFGHQWILATHIEDVTAEELQKRFIELNP
jgi:PhnB protein